jgi:predicted ribosomally synthesized peptide with SipW-like signal peptide
MTNILNARVLASIGMIVFVAAIVASSTGAFFSDTETSTGNTFTAGALDLKIDSVAHYNGMVCAAVGETYHWIPEGDVTLNASSSPVVDADMNEQAEWDAFNTANPLQYPEAGTSCTGTWPLADLGEGQLNVGTFFDFEDIKPGDEGENTISVHIDNNDAWMCVSLDNVAEADNGQNEPETEAGDDANDAVGELDENLNFFAWVDDGDNVFEALEVPLGQATASELEEETWALADSTTGNGPIQGGTTQFIGLYWCAGEITVSGNSLSCDGEAMGNIAQTDSWSADLQFYIEQARNNENFVCGDPETEPEESTIMVDKVVQFTSTAIVGVDVNDFALHINGPGGDRIVTDQVATTTAPGVYTISEVYSNDPAGIQFNASFGGSCTEIGDTGSATMTIAAGENLTCTITNLVESNT